MHACVGVGMYVYVTWPNKAVCIYFIYPNQYNRFMSSYSEAQEVYENITVNNRQL